MKRKKKLLVIVSAGQYQVPQLTTNPQYILLLTIISSIIITVHLYISYKKREKRG